MRKVVCLAFLGMIVTSRTSEGHYHMLFPNKPSAKKDEVVRFTYQFGHPYEHQLFDAARPKSVTLLAPGGKTTDLAESLREVELPDEEGKKAKGYQFSFTPAQRGDYILVVQAEPVWVEDDKEFFSDVVKVILHVQGQKGWEGQHLPAFEMVPLTRPYGLLPGMVFQAKITQETPQAGKNPFNPVAVQPPKPAIPLADALVEIEKYNAKPPKELPTEELITRTVRTDPNGVATTNLTEAGWWCLTALRKSGVREHEGKEYPVRQRSTLWVHVDEKPAR